MVHDQNKIFSLKIFGEDTSSERTFAILSERNVA
jgi:hypothetical protein